jgi:hypothetical protein
MALRMFYSENRFSPDSALNTRVNALLIRSGASFLWSVR